VCRLYCAAVSRARGDGYASSHNACRPALRSRPHGLTRRHTEWLTDEDLGGAGDRCAKLGPNPDEVFVCTYADVGGLNLSS